MPEMQKLMEMSENCSNNLSADENVGSVLYAQDLSASDRKVVNVSIFLPAIDFKSRKVSSLPLYFLLPNHYQKGSKDTSS